MPPQMSATGADQPAGIVLSFAPSRLPPLKPLRWPWAVVTVAAVGLLVGFYFAARAVEKQGEQRRLAVAAHEEATWRCQALMGRLPRANCLAQLNAPGDKVPGDTGSVVQAVARIDQR